MQATIKSISGNVIPDSLRAIDPPVNQLFYRGKLPDQSPVAIVGTRRPTSYGRRTASVLAARLAAAGLPIVSGLAFGIDTEVHRAVLDAGGQSLAVLPGGVDDQSVSPRTNLVLARRMLESGGGLASEYPAETATLPFRYIERNRLISGWARATVIVEAGLPSGSLLTARHAIEQGKDLWAVPGNIESPTSAGTNQLISDGAHPLVSIDYFLESLGVPVTESRDGFIGTEPIHVDELAERLAEPAAELETKLTKLELRGVVKHLGGRYYVRA